MVEPESPKKSDMLMVKDCTVVCVTTVPLSYVITLLLQLALAGQLTELI